MADNTAFARFITSLGSLNDYGSSVLQTKQALDLNSTRPLRPGADVAIFQDALKGIAAIKATGFSAEGVIAINQQFDTPSPEQPKLPGHLRNGYYNEDDQIGIVIDRQAKETYLPPSVVTKADVAAIVAAFEQSKQTERDAWQVFADLAKLQPFLDGNKRTALIAANAAWGAFASGDYLVLPLSDLDRVDFTTALMRYYLATTTAAETKAFDRMMALLPKAFDRQVALRRPIVDGGGNGPTIKLKRQLR